MAKSEYSLSDQWVKRGIYAYLLLPFILFCLGWLKLYLSLPITGLCLWIYWRIWQNSASSAQPHRYKHKEFWWGLILLTIWVLLSGLGGYMFQNSDYYIRNAIFRDLIQFPWPVKYNLSASSSPYYLIYYIGYWLPAALVGKVLGWQAANAFLFLWSLAGVILCALSIKQITRSSLIRVSILLIFFSGMDALGLILVHLIGSTSNYPTFWPPVQQLETWTANMQYSAFTNQLFFVFNQAIPAWLCTVLLLNSRDNRELVLIEALCSFFAPLPALGLFPLVLVSIPRKAAHWDRNGMDSAHSGGDLINLLAGDLKGLVTPENILGGGCVLGISYLYFSANPVASAMSWTPLTFKYYVVFVLVEGFALWAILYATMKKDLRWYAVGVLICLFPLIRVGLSDDFCMRASIPTLFLLMVWSLEKLQEGRGWGRTVLIIFLVIGAVTPLFNINRSVYRTFEYYTQPHSAAETQAPLDKSIYIPVKSENSHPGTLTADLYYSLQRLADFNVGLIQNYAGPTDTSRFFKHFVR